MICMLKPHKFTKPVASREINDYARQFFGLGDSSIRQRMSRYREHLGIEAPPDNFYPPEDAELMVGLIVWRAQGKSVTSYLEALNQDYVESTTT